MKINAVEESRNLKMPSSLYEKLGIETAGFKQGMSVERIKDVMPFLRKAFSFYREYPDLFLDLFADKRTKFSFYFYQRVFLRTAMRSKYFYGTFPRAFSKSFLSIMILFVRCILYPGSKLFIVSGGKEQSTKIATEKLEELFSFFPCLRGELRWENGPTGTKMQKDYIRLMFKNGSILDVVAARNSARGGRRTGGLIEEVITVDGELLNSVILPLMNVSRRAACGAVDPNDSSNKSQIYITTAGYKGTFAYDKLVQLFLWAALKPTESAVIGGTWRVPVANKLLDKNFVDDLKSDGTYSDETFNREYESVWAGTIDGAYYSPADFDKLRIMEKPLFNAFSEMKPIKGSRIIFSYDVGRSLDNSCLIVFRIIPSVNGTYVKKLVNIFSMESMHFRDQARFIKQKMLDFNCDKIVIDANGVGFGLVDFLVIPTLADASMEEGDTLATYLPALGVDRTSDPNGNYKKYYSNKDQSIYLIKATGALNSEMHKLVKTQLSSGKLNFLIDEKLAKQKLLCSREGKDMTSEERIMYLQPYALTTILRTEMMNLRRTNDDSADVSLKKIRTGEKKDKFSAFEYGLYYIRMLELSQRRKKGLSLEELICASGSSKEKTSNRGKGGLLGEARNRRGGIRRGSTKSWRT